MVRDSYINKNFIIRFYPKSENRSVKILTTARKLRALIGDEMTDKLHEAAAESSGDKFERKLRRGVTVVYVAR